MPRPECPQCLRRLPYAARKCVHCGWAHGTDPDPRLARGRARRRAIVWFVVLAGLLAGGAFATLRAPQVADWYADVAARHLPDPAAAYAVTDTEIGAYFYCARQVVRQVGGGLSVETFESPQAAESERLGEDRYRIRSSFAQVGDDGREVLREFVCTVRYSSGAWSLESLELR